MKHKKDKHFMVVDDLDAKYEMGHNMKQAIFDWWSELTDDVRNLIINDNGGIDKWNKLIDSQRFKIIEDAYENW